MTSPFIRYITGWKIEIKTDLLEKANDLNAIFKNPSNFNRRSFSGNYKHHYTVLPKHTWEQVAVELVQSLKERELDERRVLNIVSRITLQLQKLSTTQDPYKVWLTVRNIIIKNIDVLNPWVRRPWHDDIQRAADGTYYYFEGRQKVIVHGGKTLDEERLDSFVAQSTKSYGFVNGLLQLIALFFISADFKKNKKHYHKNWICHLPETDDWSSFLNWQWRLSGAFADRRLPWKPYNPMCDTQWLANDLIGVYIKRLGLNYDIALRLEDTALVQSDFKKYFTGFRHQIEVAVESGILFGKENTEAYFKYKNTNIRWINGNENMGPLIIIPVKNTSLDHDKTMNLVREFITQLVIDNGQKIKIISTVGGPARINPILHTSIRRGGMIRDSRGFRPKVLNSKKKKKAAAFYKEAVNTDNIYEEFNYLYKVVLLLVDPTEKRYSEALKLFTRWLKKHPNLLTGSVFDDVTKLAGNRSVPEYLRSAGRNAASHISRKLKSNDLTILPDDSKDINKFQILNRYIKECARIAIEELIP